MTTPVRYTADEMEAEAARFQELADDWAKLGIPKLADERGRTAAMLRQVGRCATCRHFRRDNGGDTPFGPVEPFGVCRGQRLVGGMGGKLSVPADGSGFCHLHEEAK